MCLPKSRPGAAPISPHHRLRDVHERSGRRDYRSSQRLLHMDRAPVPVDPCACGLDLPLPQCAHRATGQCTAIPRARAEEGAGMQIPALPGGCLEVNTTFTACAWLSQHATCATACGPTCRASGFVRSVGIMRRTHSFIPGYLSMHLAVHRWTGVVRGRCARQGPVPALHPCLPIPDDRAEHTRLDDVWLDALSPEQHRR